MALALLLSMLSVSTVSVSGYCWGAGQNPGFSGRPRVTQLAIDRVRVSWEGMVTQEECADNYVVKYWRRHSPNDYDITEIVPKGKYQVDIEVAPKRAYMFQAVAREEKGVVGGVDWNKSKSAQFKTSSSPSGSADGDGDDEDDYSSGPDVSTEEGVKRRVLGLSVELFVVVVVVALLLVLVFVGCLYRLACSGKSIQEDDEDVEGAEDKEEEEEEEEEEDEKKNLDPEKNGL